MGQDFRRDRGSWRYVFEYKGKKYSKTGYKTMRAAMLAEAEERKRLSIAWRPRGAEDKLTLSEYVDLWFSEHVKTNCRPRTARHYRQALDRHILPALGTTALEELSSATVRAHFAKLAGSGLAKNTVKNCLIPLRACLSGAVLDGLIQSNPATSLGRRLPRAKTEGEAAKVQAYSKSELDAILEVAPDAIATLALAGLRLGELLGLQDTDLEDDHIWVRRNVQWLDATPHVLAPKGGKARRVDVPRSLIARLRKRTQAPYLFGGEKPLRPEFVRSTWHKLLDTFWVIRRLRLHDLRHTYAALLLGKGAPPSYVKEQLGHSSIQITIDVYGHLIPGANRKWIDETFS